MCPFDSSYGTYSEDQELVLQSLGLRSNYLLMSRDDFQMRNKILWLLVIVLLGSSIDAAGRWYLTGSTIYLHRVFWAFLTVSFLLRGVWLEKSRKNENARNRSVKKNSD